MKRIGLLGGTFDPIHYGHLNAAWQSLQHLNLHEVWFIPNPLPPHRPQPQASSTQRNAMLEMAISGIANLHICTVEMKKSTAGLSVETLVTLKQQHPQYSFYWLLGNDSFNSLPTWHRWQEITEYAQLIVLTRPDHPLQISTELQSWLSLQGAKVKSIAITELTISSSDIRQQFHHQHIPRFLLPDAVLNYCLEHKLYH